MPITVFAEDLYLEVKKIVMQNGGVKTQIKLDQENFMLALPDPESFDGKAEK